MYCVITWLVTGTGPEVKPVADRRLLKRKMTLYTTLVKFLLALDPDTVRNLICALALLKQVHYESLIQGSPHLATYWKV